jgi:plastocyanin
MLNFVRVSLIVVCGSAMTFAAEVSGTVRVIQGSERGKATTIVYADPLGEHAPPQPGHYELKQKGKTFVPHFLAVPAGSTVTFPNDDPIFHNVFSMSRPTPFDLGLYRAGDSKKLVFTQPGVYRVFCNIHPQMAAVLLVVPTSWITQTDARGTYRMDLPPGRYRLTAWSERSQPVTTEVTVESAPVSVRDMTLDETKFVQMPHKNKYGQDYPLSAYDPTKK